MASDKYDPDERFSLFPLTAEQVVKRLAGENVDVDPEDVEDEDS